MGGFSAEKAGLIYISNFVYLVKRLSYLLFFSLLFILPAGAQTYNFHHYTVDDGLSQSQVLCMYQDSKGNMWFGTNSGGACRFDGNKFTTFSDKDGLVNNIVFSIAEDEKGDLYFGTSEGLSVYNGFTFHNYTDSTGLPHSRVYKVIRAPGGGMWLGTKNGPCKFTSGKIEVLNADTVLSKSSVFAISVDRDYNVWFGTLTSGAFRYNGKTVKQFSVKEGLDNNMVRTLIADNEGNTWIGTLRGLSKVKGDLLYNMTSMLGGDLVSVTSSYKNNKGELWFGTQSGAYKYANGQIKNYTEKNGMLNNKLFSILEDEEGNVWFGTDGTGVSKLSGETFINYNVKDSLPDSYITSIFMDSKKRMWLGTQGGLVMMENGKMSKYKPDLKHPDGSIIGSNVQAIYEDKEGNMWFGCKTGLSIFDGKTFKNYDVKDGLSDLNIYSITADNSGKIWLGTRNRACSYNGEKFEPFEKLNGILEKDNKGVYSIFRDANNDLWLCTDKGAVRYDHTSLKLFSKNDGFTGKRVQSVTSDANGTLWFGTDEGVFSFKNGKFIHLDDSHGLSSNKVYILSAKGNELWIGTNKGLDRMDASAFEKDLSVNIRHYGKEEGFMGVECNANALATDDKGRMWFGTVNGVTIYDPSLDKLNPQEARTRINGIRLFFQDTDLSPYSKGIDSTGSLPLELVLPFDKNHITFDFIGVSLTIPTKVKYTFKLEGIDKDWVPPTSKNEATYSSLPPGEYTFLLKASNNDGVWNKEPLVFKFTILPPWYKTWWFYSLCVLLIGGSVYMYITVRTRNLEKAKVELEQEVQLRTLQLRQEKEKVEVINKEVTAQKVEIEAKNRDITDSILYAKNIQEAILPPLDNFYNEFQDSFVLYLPKDIVSGDFYWFAKRKNKRFVAAADCTGHGVPGAFMSIIGNALLNEIVSEKEILQPAAILNELHAGVKIALKQTNSESERRDGMDIALCALTLPPSGTADGILEFAGANRALWMFRKDGSGSIEVIKPNKFPIGGLELEENRTFTNHTLDVKKGDTIYIFSDGFADQFGGGKGKKFMVRNFEKLLSSIHHLPLKEQQNILHKNFSDWKAEHEQVDDVLVIGFRI